MSKATTQVFWYLCFALLLIGVLTPNQASGQIRVPRVGFPYCQTFIGSEATLPRFSDLKFGGSFQLTGSAASLTQAPNTNSSGFFYIDIPFVPQNGIQVSFDYRIYGGENLPTSLGADGLSFFMFDGRFGANPAPNNFNIGATGGALGYASRLTGDPSSPNTIPGVSGGYLGLGIDIWGNFVSLEDNFDTPTALRRKETGIPFSQFSPLANYNFSLGPSPQTIGIRGPESTKYDIPGNNLQEKQNYLVNVFRDLGGRFLNNSSVDNCSNDQYRRLFLSLEPEGIGYRLRVKMLFGNDIVDILNQPYNFVAPNTIKLGFSAATGAEVNNHEIRNLVVGIFEPDPANAPVVEDTEFRSCEGDIVEFKVELDRILSERSFIQCIELFAQRPVQDITPQDTEILHLDCSQNQQICNVCINRDYSQGLVVPNFGTFFVDIPADVNLNDLANDEVIIRFVPFPKSPNRLNTGSIFYTITDNFGLTSQAAEFKVIINPIPEIVQNSLIVTDPSCDRQDDGSIQVDVQNLVDGFDFTWKFFPLGVNIAALSDAQLIANPGSPLPAGVVQGRSQLSPGTSRFSLTNVSLGQYILVVGNPNSDNDFCYEVLRVVNLTEESGIPIEVSEVEDTCEGDVITIRTQIADRFTTGLNTPVYIWYSGNNRSTEIIRSPGVTVLNGVRYEATADGSLRIEGLSSAGNTFQSYTFFVELNEDRSGPRVLCSNDELKYSTTLRVFPSITFSPPVINDDWCLGAVGSISIEASRGNEAARYILLDANGNILRGTQPTGNFSNLTKGLYTVRAEFTNPSCNGLFPFEIKGPDESLRIEVANSQNPSCELPNGSVTWRVTGGNGAYTGTLTGLDGSTFTQTSPGLFTAQNLPSQENPYTLVLTVRDAQGCEVTSDATLTPQILPVYPDQERTTCRNQEASATFTPQAGRAGSPDPRTLFNFFSDPGATVPLNTDASGDPNLGGVRFTVNTATGQITASNFPEITTQTTYTVYMKPLVQENSCTNLPVSKVTFTVNPLPAPRFEVVEPTCFGSTNGKLKLVGDGKASYRYSLENMPGNSFVTAEEAFIGLGIGTYAINVIDLDTGCSSRFEFTIERPEELLLVERGRTQPTCGINNGEIEFSFTGGTGNFKLFLNGSETQTYLRSQVGETFSLTGLAGGDYVLRIEDENGCGSTLPFTLNPLPLPVFETEGTEICELDPTNPDRPFLIATVRPVVRVASNARPIFTWFYLNGAGEAVEIRAGDTVFGAVASINAAFELSLQGLRAASEPYRVLLRVTGDNVCNNDLIPAEIRVNPLPAPEFEVEDLSCFGANDGKLILTSGGDPSFRYELLGFSATFQEGEFRGLPAGIYRIRITNQQTQCFEDIVKTINQPERLILEEVNLTDPTCGLDNGSYRFRFSGGTAPFLMRINGEPVNVFIPGQATALSTVDASFAGEILEIRNLAGGAFTLQVLDFNGCLDSRNFNLDPRPLPVFETEGTEICELDPTNPDRPFLIATVRPVVRVASNARPIFTWFYLNGAGEAVEIRAGDTVFGAVASINAASELSLQGLRAASEPYRVFLRVTGDNVCNNDLIPAEIRVNPLPAPEFEVEDLSCFGANDGKLILTSGGDPSFRYELLGFSATFQEGEFRGLPAGIYRIRITNQQTQCFEDIVKTINQPERLVLEKTDTIDPSCGEDNGEIAFRVVGGTAPYTVLINGRALEEFEFTEGENNLFTIKGLSPGVFSVSVTDANSCAYEERNWFTLVNNEGEQVTAIPDEQIVCAGVPVVLAPSITIGGGVTPVLRWYYDSDLSQVIVNGIDGQGVEYRILADGRLQIKGLAEGSYTYHVRISGPNVCAAATLATVDVLEAIQASVEATPVVCFGDANGRIQLSAISGATGSFEFSLDGNTWQDAPLFENLAAGLYTVHIRDTNILSGCTLMLTAVEVESPAGPITRNNPQIFAESCDSANGELANLEISGGWGNFTFEWRKDNPDTGEVREGTLTGIQNLEAGQYFLSVTDERGCKAVFEFTVGTVPDPQYMLLPPLDVCEGNSAVLAPLHIAMAPNTPTARTEVAWYKGPNQTGMITSGVDPDNPSITYTIDDSNWLNPRLEIAGLTPGTYTYYFYVACTGAEMEISVTVYATPEVRMETSRETCAGANDGRIRILSGHQNEYRYKIGQEILTQAQLEARNFPGGIYTVEVLSPQECSQSIELTIDATTALNLTLAESKNAACGQTDGSIAVEIAGGWAPFKVTLTESGTNTVQTQISNGGTVTFANLPQGAYSVSVQDDALCTAQLVSQIAVENGPSEVILEDAYFICEGETVALTPRVNPLNPNARFLYYINAVSPANKLEDGQSRDGAQYSIAADGSNFSIQGLPVTNLPLRIVVTVEGPGICEGDQKQVDIHVLAKPSVTYTTIDESCFDDRGSIRLEPAAGSGPLTYSLNGAAFQALTSNAISNLPQGSYTIQVRNQAGCLVELPNIRIEGPPAALQVTGFGNIGASCEEDNGMIFGQVSGGEAPYTLTVRSGGQVLIKPIRWDAGQFQITDLALGTYEVTLVDNRGCQRTLGSATITDEPTPVNVNDASICEGETAVLTPFIPGVANSPGYRWFRDAAKTQPIPMGITQVGAVRYELAPSGVLRVTGLTPGATTYTYFVELNFSASCALELVEAEVTVNPLPNLRTFNPSIVCDPDETVNMTNFIENFNAATFDYEVLAPSGAALRMDELTRISKSGTYLVRTKFKNNNCWSSQERILVQIAERELLADFEYQVTLGDGEILVNTDLGIEEPLQLVDKTDGNPIAWEWDFGDGTTANTQNPAHAYQETGTYTIRLTTYSELGCISISERQVVVSDNYRVIFPTAFTPRSTNVANTVFYPKFRGIASLKLYIFNTWGELIYRSESLEQGGWDGTLNGRDVPPGNYVYKAEFMSRGGEKRNVSGVVLLIR